jgi:hypothetical protein
MNDLKAKACQVTKLYLGTCGMTVLYTILVVQSSMPLNRVNFEGPFVSFDSIRTQAKVHYSETVQVQVSTKEYAFCYCP